jgi:aminoglycoside phosphotransferase (APT) family kinase protein
MRIYGNIVRRIPIEKGWSGDRKYCAITGDGEKYLLRISPAERLERKHREFENMKRVARLGIPMCLPVEFGSCEEGVYSLQSWVDGEDAESVLSAAIPLDQYRYGLDAGRILKKIHSIPAPENTQSWYLRFNAKIDRKLAMYKNCPLKYENGECLLEYIFENRQLLADRPQTYQHGDYHVGNMMIDREGTLTVIDFDRDDYGDPWEEFNRIVWSAQAAPAFAAGMVDGYFDGEIPEGFWRLLALYICSNTLSSLPWAIPFGEEEVLVMRRQAAEVLQWYDNMCTVVPSWYRAGREKRMGAEV